MLPIVFHPDYVTPLPPGHRFPMNKFQRIHDILIRDRIIAPGQIHPPNVAEAPLICNAHTRAYTQSYLHGSIDAKAMRRIGLPWSRELVTRTCTAVGGTLLTAELALEHQMACNTAGGTHHAFRDYGSGFCIFNDLAIASLELLNRNRVNQIVIIDLDVHQGDGTAAILRDEPRVFTFSMHCQSNFPFTKQESDRDISLPDEMGDADYLEILQGHLPALLDSLSPDLVLYDAGVDPHKSDRLGKLALSDEGIYNRDRMVMEACARRRIPVAAVVGGGYSDNFDELAYRHSLLHRAATAVFNHCILEQREHI